MIDWLNNDKNSAVTIYNNNITLSKEASRYFEDAYGVCVGIDTETNELVIKKINKEEFDKNYKESTNYHKVEIKASYGRINSKSLVSRISERLGLDFSLQPSFKFSAKWNNGKKMLIISTNEKKGIK